MSRARGGHAVTVSLGVCLSLLGACTPRFAVWTVDQSDTRPDGGGTLYVHRSGRTAGPGGEWQAPEVIDLGGAARDLCLAQTGTAPRRPHMVMFDPDHTYGVVAFVVSGHVLFLHASTRTPVTCIDVGTQAHAAIPSPDGRYVLVADQNGKRLHRIRTDWAAGKFTLEVEAMLDLATCTTPSGNACEDPRLRPDNAPICPLIESRSRLAFITLRGGGLLVVEVTRTPMTIVGEYDRSSIHPNGCGGVEAAGKMYINSGGGTTTNPWEHDLYALPLAGFTSTPLPPNTPAPVLLYSRDTQGEVDSHGVVLVKGRYLWVFDRSTNDVTVVDTRTDTVVRRFLLAGEVSDDPAPDLVDSSPSGDFVFASLRGPNPQSGGHAAIGSTPGVGVLRVIEHGANGRLERVLPIHHVVEGVEQADPHGLRVRVLE